MRDLSFLTRKLFLLGALYHLTWTQSPNSTRSLFEQTVRSAFVGLKSILVEVWFSVRKMYVQCSFIYISAETDIPSASWTTSIELNADTIFPLVLTHDLRTEALFSRMLVTSDSGINEGYFYDMRSYQTAEVGLFYLLNSNSVTLHSNGNLSDFACLSTKCFNAYRNFIMDRSFQVTRGANHTWIVRRKLWQWGLSYGLNATFHGQATCRNGRN